MAEQTHTCPECGRDYKKRDVINFPDNDVVTYIHGYDNPDSPMPMVDDFCRVTKEP